MDVLDASNSTPYRYGVWDDRYQVACTCGLGVHGRYLANQGRVTGRIVGWNGIERSRVEVDCTENNLCGQDGIMDL